MPRLSATSCRMCPRQDTSLGTSRPIVKQSAESRLDSSSAEDDWCDSIEMLCLQMKRIFPSDERLWFMVADGMRKEQDGKMSLFGFYGTDKLQIKAETEFPTGYPLTFVFLLRDGVGSFSVDLEIEDPAGAVTFSSELPHAKKLPGESHGVVVTMAPFVLTAFGKYRLTLTLDNRRYRRVLSIVPDIDPNGAPTQH
jgi:hypothetical protein